jgi:bacillithiol biosynthesis deacetylase BshB2
MSGDPVPNGEWTVTAPVARRHLLVVLPHPDDESFSSGGTMAMHADAGVPVTYLCGTYGDMGRNMGQPFFANRETLRDVREGELRDACRILGADVRFLGLRDKTVEFEDPDALAARIARTVRELGADLVITFYPGKAVHPDHDALGEATARAVDLVEPEARPELWAVAVGERDDLEDELGPADVRVDIRAWADRKRAALEAHATQTKTMFQRIEREAASDEHLRERLEEGSRTESFYRLVPGGARD